MWTLWLKCKPIIHTYMYLQIIRAAQYKYIILLIRVMHIKRNNYSLTADSLKSAFTPCVPCVLLEGKSKQCNFLVCHGVKKAVDNSVCKSPSLILIHGNHLVPVSRHLGKVKSLTKVHKIKYILLETTPSKTCRKKTIHKTTNNQSFTLL